MAMQNVVHLHKPEAPFAAVARQALSSALDRLNTVVPKKATVPILTAVKLESRGQVLTITGTDLDIMVAISLPVAADSTDMAAIIDLARLRAFLKASSGEFIRITSSETGDRAILYCGGSEMYVDVHDPANWPGEAIVFPKKGFSTFGISPGSFHVGLDSVIPAVSTEETRYYLNGAFMHRVDDGIRLVATDGHRLHLRDIALPGKTKFAGTGILPRRLLDVLKACIQPRSYGELLKVSVEGTLIRFVLADMVITAKMIDGTYPDYQRTMPREALSTVSISAEPLMRFLEGAAEARSVRLSFFPETCLVEGSVDGTNLRVEIDAQLEGDPVTIGFNNLYLRAAIGEASPAGGIVVFGIYSAQDAALIRGTEKHFKAVLMPMRV